MEKEYHINRSDIYSDDKTQTKQCEKTLNLLYYIFVFIQ